VAPEVVDQSGATTASDIWSLGALVIELITGKPPYHFLDPMPALFRIVNDDCPPIPEAASAVARDFLLQCFQKDCNLRVSARKLLRHPWIMAAKKQAEQQKRDQIPRASARPMSEYDQGVQKVQEYNEKLAGEEGDKRRSQHGGEEEMRRLARRPSAELALALLTTGAMPGSEEAHGGGSPTAARSREASVPLSLVGSVKEPRTPSGDEEEAGGDNWDLDFEEGISVSKINALEREGEGEDASPNDDDRTIKPISRAQTPAPTPVPMTPIVEDHSDLVGEDEADAFADKVANLNVTNLQKRLLRPDALVLTTSPAPASPIQAAAPASAPAVPPSLAGLYGAARRPSGSGSAGMVRRASMEQYTEQASEEDDYSDLFVRGTTLNGRQTAPPTLGKLRLNTRLSSKSWMGDEDSDEEDPFAQVEEEEGFGDGDLEANLARDKLARLCANVTSLVDIIAAEADDFELREAALELLTILDESADARAYFTNKAQGMLAITRVLQITRSREILGILLRIVNLVIGFEPSTLEKICLVGGCPVVMAFASNKYSREIRLEAALFIGAMCRTSLLTLQMFISCRGLRTLVDMVDENYAERKDLVWMAVDGISRVFEMHGPGPRNDFCRIFVHEGLLEPIAGALRHTCADDDDLAESAKAKIIHILLMFSQSDNRVKEAMGKRPIVLRKFTRMGAAD